jgi:hypothetical protein
VFYPVKPNFSSKLFFTHPSPSKEGKEKSPLSTTPLPPFIKGEGGRGVVSKEIIGREKFHHKKH